MHARGTDSFAATARRRAATSDAQRSGPSCDGTSIAVDDAARLVRRGKPLDRQPPARELAFDAHARRLAGDVDADGARGPLEVLPVAQRERADVLVGDGAARQSIRAGPRIAHFIRLLPTSMTRIWVTAAEMNGSGSGLPIERRAPHTQASRR